MRDAQVSHDASDAPAAASGKVMAALSISTAAALPERSFMGPRDYSEVLFSLGDRRKALCDSGSEMRET